jgi:oligoribonuclease NrnB/cAMP/cGMP phosphodiesterase (DHH superfamily)
MKTVVIYHRADFDGIFCYRIARKFLGDENVTYIGWDYGDPEPGKAEIDGTERLYIMDLSVPSLMDHPNLIWIDHHKSAIDRYRDSKGWHNNRFAYCLDGVAACRLAWQWFNKGREGYAVNVPVMRETFFDRKVIEPLAVRLAGEYDIWDKRDPRAELFQHGLRSMDLGENMWELLLVPQEEKDGKIDCGTATVEALLDRGEAVQYARRQDDENAIKSCGYTIEWEGLKFLAVNAGARGFNSFLFAAGLKPEHDACLGWRMVAPGKYSVSLYGAPGKDHDLSAIASKYGGGGHKQACGFTCGQLPF